MRPGCSPSRPASTRPAWPSPTGSPRATSPSRSCSCSSPSAASCSAEPSSPAQRMRDGSNTARWALASCWASSGSGRCSSARSAALARRPRAPPTWTSLRTRVGARVQPASILVSRRRRRHRCDVHSGGAGLVRRRSDEGAGCHDRGGPMTAVRREEVYAVPTPAWVTQLRPRQRLHPRLAAAGRARVRPGGHLRGRRRRARGARRRPATAGARPAGGPRLRRARAPSALRPGGQPRQPAGVRRRGARAAAPSSG